VKSVGVMQNQSNISIWKRATVSSLKALPTCVPKCEPEGGGVCAWLVRNLRWPSRAVQRCFLL